MEKRKSKTNKYGNRQGLFAHSLVAKLLTFNQDTGVRFSMGEQKKQRISSVGRAAS
jgi:hypothetical protein